MTLSQKEYEKLGLDHVFESSLSAKGKENEHRYNHFSPKKPGETPQSGSKGMASNGWSEKGMNASQLA